MNSDGADLAEIQRRLCCLPYSLTVREISDVLWINSKRPPIMRGLLDDNQDLICTCDDENGEERYIAKRTLYQWFVRLSIRLARISLYRLDERQLLSKLNSLRLEGTWDYPPREYVEFGQTFGLLNRTEGQNRYGFPISAVMSFLSQASSETVKSYLLQRSYDADIMPGFEQLIVARLRDMLETLGSSKDVDIIVKRNGILGFDAMTLEAIGQQLGVTREWIRQIEAKCWRRIQRPGFRRRLAPLLMVYILNRKGSMVVSRSKIQPEIEFLCRCLGVPLWTFPLVDVRIIGDGVCGFMVPKGLGADLANLDGNVRSFISSLPLWLPSEDVEEIATILAPIIAGRRTKTQKACLALKAVGRPAHFSEVAEMYNQMFPGERMTERNVHALLHHGKHGIVWVGSKGKFALKEWGYERPESSLMDTIAQIVTERYESTGNPVPLVVIQAEIGKHRRVINPNSVLLASYCNPRLQSAGNSCFLPREDTDGLAEEVTDDELDRALRRFEQRGDKW